MILRKLTTAALAWPLVRHLFHFVRKYVAGQKCGSCPPFLLQTLNIKPRHTLLEPELYSWQQAISPAIKSLPHSGHAVEPIGTDTMQNQQIIVVVLGSTLKGIVAVKPNVCMECAGVRRGQAALGHAGSVASFSGCFQGLVGKAKQLTVSAASANLPAQEAARISERDDSAFKRKVIRESLSLDT